MNETHVIAVEGMGCQSCVAAVQKALSGVAAGSTVSVDLAAGTVTIEKTPAPLSVLKAAIEAAGYDVKG